MQCQYQLRPLKSLLSQPAYFMSLFLIFRLFHFFSFTTFLLGALAFDMEYARWMEEQDRQINDLRAAVSAHASDTDLNTLAEGIMSHYDEIFKLKGIAAKTDVFHILSGMWKTPAERCFLWLGGFRSSELLKVMFFSFYFVLLLLCCCHPQAS